jgi:hypothetical protein
MLPAVASMVKKYLPSIKAKIFPISPSPLKTEVPRAFLRATFGGADQQFLQIFRKDKHPKGAIMRRVVFPQFGLNPAMPSRPGQPGLVFASRHEILENPPWSVFRKRLSDSGKAAWLYLGDYESELMGKMSRKEFSDLATSVSTWSYFALFLTGSLKISPRSSASGRKHCWQRSNSTFMFRCVRGSLCGRISASPSKTKTRKRLSSTKKPVLSR